jgi:hypothetical protein
MYPTPDPLRCSGAFGWKVIGQEEEIEFFDGWLFMSTLIES